MKIRILELPLDFGANRRGSDMGPSVMRLAGLKETLTALGHECSGLYPGIPVPAMEFAEEGNPKAKFLEPITRACRLLAEETERALEEGCFPLALGGDHSISIGSLSGLGAFYKKRGVKWGCLWVDAHGDFNTHETSVSGNIHGMILAAACGYGLPELTGLYGDFVKLDPAHTALIGVRDLDSSEKTLMKNAGLTVFTMTELDRLGIAESCRRLVSFFKGKVDRLHVSVDMDALDPAIAPGVGIPLSGGLSHREVLLLAEELSASGLVASADIVEVNPVLDVQNRTAHMAVEIAGRLLGGRIY